MPTARITQSLVDSMPAHTTTWDDQVRGFGVQRRSGTASFLLKTSVAGRQKLLTIGRAGRPWTAAAARKEAQRLIGEFASGRDPQVARAKAKAEPTVAEVLDRYVEEYAAVRNKPSTLEQIRWNVERNLKPAFGDLKIGALSRAQISKWHSGLAKRPYTANRALAYLRKALNLAANQWDLRADNPAAGVQLYREQHRERFYSADELARLGEALTVAELQEKLLEGALRAIRLLALTGMRLGEVTGLRWVWLDVDAGCIRLPDAKGGSRLVPLGDSALKYLATLKRVGPFVCHGSDPAKPISPKSVKRAWSAIRERAEIPDGRMHDLRHTVATLAAGTGANAFLVRDLLGHRTVAMSSKYVGRSVDPIRATADQVSSRISEALDNGWRKPLKPE
jgi:integrase